MLDSIVREVKNQSRTYLRELFTADKRPWVVAFSGGKDSTVLLHLVYEMILEKGRDMGKPVYVLSSDTRVEAPVVANYVSDILDGIEKHAQKNRLPIEVVRIQPLPEESFWGKLIGKGYPSPTRWFRWCTASMKIRPAKLAVSEIVQKFGSIIILLGTRYDESPERKRRMENRESGHLGLDPHREINNALVSLPIAHWSNDHIWYFLKGTQPPWGGSYEKLRSLYQQATGGECPSILDMIAPSCGGTRFGCWTCTVVKKDISMRGFLASGEDWMRPLYDFRNRLKQIREDQNQRMPVRRNGAKGMGPFTYETRKRLLRELLDVEAEINILLANCNKLKTYKKISLLSDQELACIQNIWTSEFDSRQSAFEIAKGAGRKVDFMSGLSLPPSEQQILEELIREFELPPSLVDKLLFLATEKYASLEVWGNKAALEKEVKESIENAVKMKLYKEVENDI